MRVTILYFAAVRELVGIDREEREITAASVRELVDELERAHEPLAGRLRSVRLAVNEEFADPDRRLNDGDVVALIPPVAGGSSDARDRVAMLRQPLSLDEVSRLVSHAGAGAVAIFVGAVRDHNEGRAVTALEYTAYESMAVAEMARIVEEIEREIPVVRLAAHHRLGELAVGDAAVICAASSPHRGEAFTAGRLLIDRIKERVPIWKRERGPDGDAWVGWEDARCTPGEHGHHHGHAHSGKHRA